MISTILYLLSLSLAWCERCFNILSLQISTVLTSRASVNAGAICACVCRENIMAQVVIRCRQTWRLIWASLTARNVICSSGLTSSCSREFLAFFLMTETSIYCICNSSACHMHASYQRRYNFKYILVLFSHGEK